MKNDIKTSLWGPYSNLGSGISNILPDACMMSMIPICGYMSSHRPYPQTRSYNQEFRPLKALPDLSYYSFRHYIAQDNSTFADIEYFTIDNDSAIVLVDYKNNGKLNHFMETFLSFTFESPENSKPPVYKKGEYEFLVVADYIHLNEKKANWHKREKFGIETDPESYHGKIFSCSLYPEGPIEWKLKDSMKKFKFMALRYKNTTKAVDMGIDIGEKSFKMKLKTSGASYAVSKFIKLPESIKNKDAKILTKLKKTFAHLQLDSFIFSNRAIPPQRESSDKKFKFPLRDLKFDKENNTAVFGIKGKKLKYGIYSKDLAEETEFFPFRQAHFFEMENIERACELLNFINLNQAVYHKEYKTLSLGAKYFKLAPEKHKTQIFIIGKATSHESLKKILLGTAPKASSIIEKKRNEYKKFADFFAGANGDFVEALSAQTFCNINYPEYIDDKPVKYYSPSKRYNTFYQWDAGMTGIALNHISPERSEELLSQYFNCNDRSKAPFLKWGTVLPIQIFHLWDLFAQTGDEKLLHRHLKGALRMYDFFVGKTPFSRMRDSETGLINNFHYNYNSGGWDDYPPQQYARIYKKQKTLIPVVCLSQTILAAKLIRCMASITGASNLIDEMSDDIHKMEKKLYKYHWNEKEGLFSYYDKENQSFFKLNGEEANKGLDGYYPLVSSSVPQETASAFAQKLFDPEKFLTNYGITTVDKTAKYFREDGYWNGHVWVPHNWFIWKALLDYGYASQARLLAKRLFKGFCDAFYRSGNIVECLHHETGQEEHVPFFSGLNGQLFNLYKAYSGKNVFSVSSGFQSYAKLKQKGRKIELEIISPFFKGKSAFVLNLKPNKKYQIFEEGAQVAKFKTDGSASADICLQLTKNSHQYEISECLNPH